MHSNHQSTVLWAINQFGRKRIINRTGIQKSRFYRLERGTEKLTVRELELLILTVAQLNDSQDNRNKGSPKDADDLIAGATVNLLKDINCSVYRPCQRFYCSGCMQTRREFYQRRGALFATMHKLDIHLTVSWPIDDEENFWQHLSEKITLFSKIRSNHRGKFMRTLGMGKAGNLIPHVHTLMNSRDSEKLVSLVEKVDKTAIAHPSEAYDHAGLLGYWFDRNFLPVINDPNRPKGMRVLSGSRGMPYGYPKKADWDVLENIEDQLQGGH